MKGVDLCDSARNIAAILLARHGSTVPVDVIGIIKNYAELEIVPIPFQFDGIVLDIGCGARPRIIINARIPGARMRFTAAHELGHVIIPWHRGVFLDDESLDTSQRIANVDAYIEMERQANAFASELLMPKAWLAQLINEMEASDVHLSLIDQAQVSPQAAAINLIRALPPGHVYAVTDDSGMVLNAGRSDGTLAVAPEWQVQLPSNSYEYAERYRSFKRAGSTYHWWCLPTSVGEEDSSASLADWRTILDEIVGDLVSDQDAAKKFKLKVNGVVGFVNSQCRRNRISSQGAIRAAVIQRFNDRAEYASFAKHSKFSDFVASRVHSLAVD